MHDKSIHTSTHSFYSFAFREKPLFSVNGGIPASDALDEACAILSLALEISTRVASDLEKTYAFAVPHLIEQAQAIVDSTINGGRK